MKFIREIARGGFGTVDEVELENGERVARKTFSPRLPLAEADLAKFRSRFVREVRVQEALPQATVLPILAYDLDRDEPWYLMPLADRNLRIEIEEGRRERSIPRDALADILNGLEELHLLGYVHRDLKPENVVRP